MKKSDFMKEFIVITFATLIVSAAVFFFLIPSQVSVGSISGLAMILGNIIPLHISIITFILNGLLLIIGFLLIGNMVPRFFIHQRRSLSGYGLLYLCCKHRTCNFIPGKCLLRGTGYCGKAVKQIFPHGHGKSHGASRYVRGPVLYPVL